MYSHLLITYLLAHSGDLFVLLPQFFINPLPLLHKLSLILVLLTELGVLLLEPGFSNVNACLKVLGSLHIWNPHLLFIFLLFDYVKLSLNRLLSLALLGGCQSLKLLSISEGVPGGSVLIQNIFIRSVKRISIILLINTVLVFFFISAKQLCLCQKSLYNFKRELEPLNILL